MKYTAEQIVEPLERFAPLTSQEKWDNSGFLVGNSKNVVTSVLIGLDCTPALVEEAVKVGANMIITHHPLIFNSVKSIFPTNFLGKTITELIKNDIVLYSAHTNMDKAAGGVSGLMAEKLGMKDCVPLSQEGFGLIGNLDKPMDAESFIKNVKILFGVKSLKVSKPLKNKIQRIALCGGAGRDFIPEAVSEGAQVYITGDLGYHNFYPEDNFMVMDIGHYESEIAIVNFIKEIICEKFANFAVHITKINNNQIYYY